MRNLKLLKVLGMILLGVVILTWIVPATEISASGVLERGSISPIGLYDIFGSFDVLAQYFLRESILILLIGMFYGVINRTGAYKVLIDKISSKFKHAEKFALILSILVFIAVPALTNMYTPMFVIIPLFVNVLLKLGFNKKTVLLSTFGSVLIGMSSNISNQIFVNMNESGENVFLWFKVAFLVVSLALTMLYAIKTSKPKKGTKKEEINEEAMIVPRKLETESKVKVSMIPLAIVMVLVFVLFILGLTSWNFDFFTTMHSKVMGVRIKDFAIIQNLLGGFNSFGNWSYPEIWTVLISGSVVVGLIYKLKFKDFVEGAKEGMSKFAAIALFVAIINLIVMFTFNSGFLSTIINLLAAKGNVALTTLATMISTPFVVDQTYMVNYTLTMVYYAAGEAANMDVFALAGQLVFGVVMLVLPVSAMMMTGLMYLEESYKDWIKYIWKLATILIITVFIAITIATLI